MIRTHVLSVLKNASSQVKYPYLHRDIFMCVCTSTHVFLYAWISVTWMFICGLHQVHHAIRSTGGSKTSISEGVEASVIYVRFKAASTEVVASFSLFFYLDMKM